MRFGKKIRVGLMIESDGPGGAESVVLSLSTGLRERGFEVKTVVHGGGPGWLSGRLRDEGFEVYQPVLKRPFDPSMVLQLSRWLKAEGIAITHSHEFTTSVYGGLASKLAGIPNVITMHGGLSYTYELRRRVALSCVARLARGVVGVSEATACTLKESLLLDSSQVRVIPNGIDARNGDRRAGRDSLGVKPSDFLILAVGNLYPVKGHDVLIRAAARLKERYNLAPWRVMIAGRGEHEETLRALIESYRLGEAVTLLGLRDDVPNLLAACDLFVMPSRSEGLPMAMLEAMLATRPVVASNVGGIPTLLQGGKLGQLVDPDDDQALAEALMKAISNYPHALEIAQRGFVEATQNYSSQRMVEAYLAVYGF